MRQIDRDFVEYITNCGDHSEGSKSIRADAFYAAYNVKIKEISQITRKHEDEIAVIKFKHEKAIMSLLAELNSIKK